MFASLKVKNDVVWQAPLLKKICTIAMTVNPNQVVGRSSALQCYVESELLTALQCCTGLVTPKTPPEH